MESSRLGLLRSSSKARSSKVAGSQNKADVPPVAKPEDAAKEAAMEEKHEKSRSWFSPRRKDSVASTILRSSKSFRRLSAVSSAASSQAAISTPTTPSFSRGSYESDAAFHHRKLSPLENGEAPVSEPAPTDPPSIPYPPHRPERPQGDLFEGTPLEKANQLDKANLLEKANQQSHRPSRSRSILRPFSPFPGPSIRDLRRLSQHSEHKLQANSAADAVTTTTTATGQANRLSTETEQVHEPVDVAMTPASPKPSTYSVLSAPAPIVPNRRTSLRPSSKGSEAGITRKASIASSFHFSIHRRPSHVTAEIESRKNARSSRWTLTENMAEMFKGQHIKTDKQTMTPAQIEAIWNGQDNGGSAAAAAKQKQKKGKERRMKAASDTSASISRSFGGPLTEQQNNLFSDPFQWPGKMSSPVPMSRADIQMRHLPFEITVPPPPSTILGSPEIFHGDVSPKSPTKVDRRHIERHSVPRLVLPDAEDVAIEDDDDSTLASSIPIPPKNPARFVARAPTMPLLPPIMEGFRSPSGSNRSSNISSHRRSRSCNHASEVKDDMITFTSTPYTMANPSFRHGPIVLSDAGSRDSVTTVEAVEEEERGAVDLSTLSGKSTEELEDVIPGEQISPDEEEGQMADEVADWYDGLNLGSPGKLISDSEKSEKKSDRSTQRDSAGSMTSAASTPSTVQTEAEAELQTPVTTSQHPSLFDSIVQFRSGCESTYSASVYDDDSDGEMSRKEIDELAPTSVASKQAMEHGYEAFLGYSLDDSY